MASQNLIKFKVMKTKYVISDQGHVFKYVNV